MKPPTFRSIPAFEVGMPVLRAMFCFAFVMPSALFHEKDNPGIGVERLSPILQCVIKRLQCNNSTLLRLHLQSPILFHTPFQV